MKRPLASKRPLGPFISYNDSANRDIIFRGASLRNFNNQEFRYGEIEGSEYDLWVLDMDAVVQRYGIGTNDEVYRKTQKSLTQEFGETISIEQLSDNGLIKYHTNRSVTSGLSSNIGTSYKFSIDGGVSSIKDLPTVLFIDRNSINGQLIDVKYTERFKQENPLIAGAVDKGSEMLGVPHIGSDKIYSFHAVDSEVKWQLNPLNKFNNLGGEAEIAAYRDSVNIKNSVSQVAVYIVERAFNEIDSRHLDRVYSIEEASRRLYPIIQDHMVDHSEKLVMVGLTDDTYIVSGDQKVERDEFKWLYDGNEFTTDYYEAIPFTDPTRL